MMVRRFMVVGRYGNIGGGLEGSLRSFFTVSIYHIILNTNMARRKDET